jgi:hypothetical protein
VIAFILTSSLTVVSSLASLWLQRRIKQRKSPALDKNTAKSTDAESPILCSNDVWAHVLEHFILQLSDQQLFVGLIQLICAFGTSYRDAVAHKTKNLWHAADVACFSIFSHAATMLALRAHFRMHKMLAAVRVSLMVTVFLLWAEIGRLILRPPRCPSKPQGHFYRSAVRIEIIGIIWVYILTCVPIFISEEASAVGRAISSNDQDGLKSELNSWYEKRMSSHRNWYHHTSLLATPGRILVKLLSSIQRGPKWKLHVLFLIHNIFFSRHSIALIIFIFWAFAFVALCTTAHTYSRKLRDGFDFGQLLSLGMVILPVQSLLSAICSKSYFDI